LSYETIRVEVEEHIATVTLDRPEAGNTLNTQMHRELSDAWGKLRYDGDVWTTILTGAGESFCLGEDYREIAEALKTNTVPPRYREPHDGRQWGFYYEHYRRRKGNVWKPLIVAVNGACSGAGLVFAGQADVVIAAESASFVCPEVELGIVPVDEVLYLADKAPVGEILRLALLGEAGRIDAKRATEIALASESVADAELLKRSQIIAMTINDQAGDAVRSITATMHMRRDLPYHTSGVLGTEYHARFQNLENQLEGPRAFTEKRKPQWTIRPPKFG
jgi:enoyl-CoA hydratase/carnithine racemase